MKKVYTALLVSCLFFFSCKENSDTPQPIKDLIAKYSSCQCDPFIDKYQWKGKEIYLSSCRGPACNCTTTYYDSKGAEFKMPEGYTHDNFRKDSKFLKNIWACKN